VISSLAFRIVALRWWEWTATTDVLVDAVNMVHVHTAGCKPQRAASLAIGSVKRHLTKEKQDAYLIVSGLAG
jgi:hypothetical protein